MLPQLRRLRKSETYIDVFRGLNRSINTGFSDVSSNSSSVFIDFKNMKNLCSDDYPQLRTRKKRSRILTDKKVISNLIAVNGNLIFIDEDGNLIYKKEKYAVPNIDLSAEHNLVTYGNNVVVFPDNLIFELSELKFTQINNSYTALAARNRNIFTDKYGNEIFDRISISKCQIKSEGTVDRNKLACFHRIAFSDESEQEQLSDGSFKYEDIFNEIETGDIVEDLYSSPSLLYKCYTIDEADDKYLNNQIKRFVKLNDYYVRISTTYLSGFKAGDFVKISGIDESKCVADVDDEGTEIPFDWGNFAEVLNNQIFKIYYVIQNTIVIKADIDKSVAYEGNITFERIKPETDFDKCIEVNNRLWACNSKTNEIYASKQGDCTNWQAYSDGISTDSFAMTVGSEGDFTGIARQNDSVIFFKENWALKLYGTKPSNYTLASYNILGVQKGSAKSVVWINGVLYYLSNKGVCRYSPGSQPEIISESAFGDEKYKNGVAGRHNDKYYISAENSKGEYEMFVYDTRSGIWEKEDNTQMISTVTYNNTMYYVDGNTGYIMCTDEDNNIISSESDFEKEKEFDWKCETGDLYDSSFESKYISRISIGLKTDSETKLKVYAQFNDGGAFKELKTIRYDRKKPQMIPVAVRRSDYLRLRIEGKGQCNIYGIMIEYAQGSMVR